MTRLQDLPPDDQTALAAVPASHGRVLVVQGHKLAVYRDEADNVVAFSPLCPHMRGALAWNATDRTWDCNLHGGRFHADGSFLSGPGDCAMHAATLASAAEPQRE